MKTGRSIVIFLRAVGLSVAILLAGVVMCRLGEVWNLILDFYTTFTWETFITVLLAGAVAGSYFGVRFSHRKRKEKPEFKD